MSNAVIAFQVPRATYVGHLYYELWRSTTQLADTLAATVEAGATKLRDVDSGVAINGGLTPGATYWYYLASVRSDGERGPFSEYEYAATTLTADNIADNAITLAKIEQIATSRLLGRSAAGTGDVEVLDAATVRGILGMDAYQYTVADDSAVSFDNPADSSAALLIQTVGFQSPVALVWARTTSSPSTNVVLTSGSKGFAAGSGVLTGTSGANDTITVSAHSDGKVYIENRYGAELIIRVTVLSAI